MFQLELWLRNHKRELHVKAPEQYAGNMSVRRGRKTTQSQQRALDMGRTLGRGNKHV